MPDFKRTAAAATLAGSILASTLDRTLNGGSSLVIETTGPDSDAVRVGWAQLLSTGNVGGFATFTIAGSHQEAVVPLETRNASSFRLAFDNSGGLLTGLAIANLSSQPATIPLIIRDDTGLQIGTPSIQLPGHGHTSFMLTQNYAVTAGKRGTVEFDAPSGGQISVLGLRSRCSGFDHVAAAGERYPRRRFDGPRGIRRRMADYFYVRQHRHFASGHHVELHRR